MTLSPADYRAQQNSPWEEPALTPAMLTTKAVDALLLALDKKAQEEDPDDTYGFPIYSGERMQALRDVFYKWYYQQATGAE